jgi:type III secretion protein V
MRLPGIELLLPAAVLAVVAMLVFPLPLHLLDILLLFNLAISIALLVSAVYLPEPERFTALPALLLITTLFRLGLNISTTRQLLAHGVAPDTVIAFGRFVVGGSLITGAVIFVIITIVQFLVIAKGAERVAEVAARFTLDALPGKQMAIDADVRAGLLSVEEARFRRIELQRESKLYGALDGAMKFVKGDVIAGILITLVNICAGLIVGTVVHGFALAEAVQRYSIYTIGDGLVSQLPALLVAVAAGITVTRVSQDENSFLGNEVLAQLGSEPKVLAVTGCTLCLLAFVPGLPAFALLGIGGLFLVGYRRAGHTQARRKREQDRCEFIPKVYSGVVIKLGASGVLALQQDGSVAAKFLELRGAIFERVGVIVPDLQFDVSRAIEDRHAVIYIHALQIGLFDGRGDQGAANGNSYTSLLLGVVERLIVQNIDKLVDDTHTRILLGSHQLNAGEAINSLVPSVISVTGLTSILRRFVKEKISIRDLRAVLQAIADFSIDSASAGEAQRWSRQRHLRELYAAVRIAMAETIVRPLLTAGGGLNVHLLAPALDLELARSVALDRPIDPEVADEVIRALRSLSAPDQRTIVLATKYARAAIAVLLEEEQLTASVLAAEELPNGTDVKVVGVINSETKAVADEAVSYEEAAVAA